MCSNCIEPSKQREPLKPKPRPKPWLKRHQPAFLSRLKFFNNEMLCIVVDTDVSLIVLSFLPPMSIALRLSQYLVLG